MQQQQQQMASRRNSSVYRAPRSPHGASHSKSFGGADYWTEAFLVAGYCLVSGLVVVVYLVVT